MSDLQCIAAIGLLGLAIRCQIRGQFWPCLILCAVAALVVAA